MTPAELRDARESLGLTVAEAASVLETDPTTIERIERDPSLKTARPAPVRVAQLYGAYLEGFRPANWPPNKAVKALSHLQGFTFENIEAATPQGVCGWFNPAARKVRLCGPWDHLEILSAGYLDGIPSGASTLPESEGGPARGNVYHFYKWAADRGWVAFETRGPTGQMWFYTTDDLHMAAAAPMVAALGRKAAHFKKGVLA